MPGQMEAELPNGLIAGHAYSVTAVKLVSVNQLTGRRGLSFRHCILAHSHTRWSHDPRYIELSAREIYNLAEFHCSGLLIVEVESIYVLFYDLRLDNKVSTPHRCSYGPVDNMFIVGAWHLLVDADQCILLMISLQVKLQARTRSGMTQWVWL